MLPREPLGSKLRRAVPAKVAPAKLRIPASKRSLSAKGLNFIAGYEGFRAHPYNDAAGHATIGFGHLLHYGPVRANERGMTWSREKALSVLRADAHSAADAVRKLPVNLTQGEFDALVSIAFNVGTGVLDRGRSLGDAIRSGNRAKTAKAFGLYVYAGSRPLAGLVRRRAAEAKVFTKGAYS